MEVVKEGRTHAAFAPTVVGIENTLFGFKRFD
jgi:hypothetical protein